MSGFFWLRNLTFPPNQIQIFFLRKALGNKPLDSKKDRRIKSLITAEILKSSSKQWYVKEPGRKLPTFPMISSLHPISDDLKYDVTTR